MRKYITPDALAAEVMMQRSLFKGAFVFVEGDSDERFYSLFTDNNSCQIVITHGCVALWEVCKILEDADFKGFIGISDADFDHLEKIKPPLDSILLTDWHDVECYLLRSEALSRVIQEFGHQENIDNWKSKWNVSDIRQHFLEEVAKVGFLLWHSLSCKIGLRFDGLDVSQFTCKATLTVNEELLTGHIKKLSTMNHLSCENMIEWIRLKKLSNCDLWHVVCGHHFVYALRFALAEIWGRIGKPNVSIAMLESVLRAAYPKRDFFTTNLCTKILAWESGEEDNYQILKKIDVLT